MRFSRSALVFLSDVSLAMLAWWGAFLLRFNFAIPPLFVDSMLYAMPFIVVVQAVVFRMFGLYQGIWRFASLPDLQRLVRAIGAVAVLGPVFVWLLQGKGIVPQSTCWIRYCC
jgi:FlaA1/EpsC-like NDP-sugar epimerase